MYDINFNLIAYEVMNDNVSGYKMTRKGEVIGTIEKRDGKWISCIFTNDMPQITLNDTLEQGVGNTLKVLNI